MSDENVERRRVGKRYTNAQYRNCDEARQQDALHDLPRLPEHDFDYNPTCEESVNRSLVLALVLLGAAPAATPLVTGSVRDTSGQAIVGALVSGRGADGTVAGTTTAADGTFALRAAGVEQVEIRCRFCMKAQAPVAADGTAIVIVRRFGALASDAPTRADIANLPYAHVESDITLRPFAILENSTDLAPGPQLSDRVAQRGGGLVVDAGLPAYDIATGLSPFLTIPDRYTQSVASVPQSGSFRYGDLADDGTFVLDPRSEGSDASVTTGDGTALRAGNAGDGLAISGGLSNSASERRSRVDAQYATAIPQGTVLASVLASDGSSLAGSSALSGAFTGATASVERTQGFTERFDAYADRGSYVLHYDDSGFDSSWSDSGAAVTLHANATIAPFAQFGVRSSAGSYAGAPPNVPNIAATLTQAQEILGVHASAKTYDVLVALGGYDAAYAGGSYGRKSEAAANAGTPLVRVRFTLGDRWSLDVSTGESFRLPTFTQNYNSVAMPTNLQLDRDSTLATTVGYTDASRVSLEATALVRNTNGFDTGRITSVGGSLAWQIAPALSVRAWWLRETPDQYAETTSALLGAAPQATGVGSLWLSYDAGHLRVDAIWRQDLLNYLPDAHLDASVSGPFDARMRWFIGTERLLGVHHVDAGLRFAAP